MARRRKKTARGDKKANGALLDKSLPAIPPPEARKTTYVPGTTTLWSDVYPEIAAPSVSETMTSLRAELPGDSILPPVSSQTPSQPQGMHNMDRIR